MDQWRSQGGPEPGPPEKKKKKDRKKEKEETEKINKRKRKELLFFNGYETYVTYFIGTK